MPDRDVTINLGPLVNLRDEISRGIRRPNSSNPIRGAIRKWAVRVRSFLQERFDKLSKGGGEWPPLAPSTIARRRKPRKRKRRSGGRSATILRDTGQLFNALRPVFRNDPGAIENHSPFGVTIGFGGSRKHSNGKKTVAQIATFHQRGGNRLPQRKIIVEPDARTIDLMREDMVAAIRSL